MKVLLTTMEKCIEDSDYIHEEKPLSWLQTLDKMTDTKEHYLPYDGVVQFAAESGVPEAEVPVMLQFLFEMGMLMWHPEPGLSDVVIMDPVAYFVTPATLVICKHKETNGDPTRHFAEIHRECQNNYPRAFDRMLNKGVVSETLLRALLREYEGNYDKVVQLMEKYSLLVAVKSPIDSSNTVMEYVVPALLQEASPHIPWSGRRSSFAFVFSVGQSLECHEVLTPQILRSEGFLPSGLFERLIGKALLWSQQTGDSTYTLQLEQVYRNAAVLRYGGQRFCIRAVHRFNLIHVEVEGINPISVHQRLSEQISGIVSEIMASLTFVTVLHLSRVDDGSLQYLNFVSLRRVIAAFKDCSPLFIGSSRPLIQTAGLKSMYGCWVQHDEVLSKYDMFLSYRWHEYDSTFTESLFDSLTLYSIGEPSRAIDVFRDKRRLKDGKDFQSEYCRALTQTSVVVPIVSVNTLEEMITHNPSRVDNVLVEWICALLCYQMRDRVGRGTRVRRIIPLVFGEKLADGTIKSLLNTSRGIRSQLPEVFPTASFNKAVSLLNENGIVIGPYKEADFTVAQICNRILAFQSSIKIDMLTVDQYSIAVSLCPQKLLIILREALLEDPVIESSLIPQNESDAVELLLNWDSQSESSTHQTRGDDIANSVAKAVNWSHAEANQVVEQYLDASLPFSGGNINTIIAAFLIHPSELYCQNMYNKPLSYFTAFGAIKPDGHSNHLQSWHHLPHRFYDEIIRKRFEEFAEGGLHLELLELFIAHFNLVAPPSIMMSDILDCSTLMEKYRDNKQFLLETMTSYVVVTGTGVSVAIAQRDQGRHQYNPVLWGGLLDCIIDELNNFNRDGNLILHRVDLEPLDKAQYIFEIIQQQHPYLDYRQFVSMVMRSVQTSDSQNSTNLSQAIDRLGLPIATTNYDLLLEGKLRRFEFNLTNDNAVFNPYLASRFIYHLHGVWFDFNTVVLRQGEYDTSYIAFERAIRNLLFEIPQTDGVIAQPPRRSFLFIGCGGGVVDDHFNALFTRQDFSDLRHVTLLIRSDIEQNWNTLPRFRLAVQSGRLIPVCYGEEYADLTAFIESLSLHN